MKLGLVRRGYSGTGGAEAYLRRFAEAARGAGHECVLFASEEWAGASWEGEKRLIPGGSPRSFADALRAAQPREHCDLLFSLERVWECDAYRAGDGVHASWLERRKRYEPWWKPLIRGWQRKHREILDLERALFTGGARCIIANSRMVEREIIATYATPVERIRVVYNGLPGGTAEPGARMECRNALGLAEHEYTLLFAGSGWERKGLVHAIAAIERVAEATLLVAGKGRTRGLQSNSRVRFLGPQSHAEMQKLLAAADAFILPTLYEPFSNACLEALAAGLPVITTRANGFAEILAPGEGSVLVEPADHASLAAAIREWADPGKRAAVRTSLRAKGAEFSIERNLRETLEILTRVAGGA